MNEIVAQSLSQRYDVQNLAASLAVLAPRGRDAAVVKQLLAREAIETVVVASLDALAVIITDGIGAVLVTEEALAGGGGALHKALEQQATWSDVPFIVLANGAITNRSNQASSRLNALQNAVLLSRPLHAEELIRSVRSALTARGRQHQSRTQMEQLRLREKQLHESEAKFHAIADFVDQMIWSTTPDGLHDYFNHRWYEFTGVLEGSTNGEEWNGVFHADDQARAWDRWNHSLATGEPYEIEYRLRHRSGEYRWVLGRAQAVLGANGEIQRWYGSCTDIHEIKIAEEQRQLMLAEMNHRVKNSLAMVHAMVSQTLRQAESLVDAKASIESRISMMSQAHDRLVQSTWTNTHILEVVLAALAPHSNGEGRTTIGGPDLPIGSKQALALTMALHELATNAIKYGAWLGEIGQVDVNWKVENTAEGEMFIFSWTESDGPKVQKPERRGFGSRMIEQALAGYFSGTAELRYEPDGLSFDLKAPLAGLTG